jgi:succinoglycan biosynthesis protein ExoA
VSAHPTVSVVIPTFNEERFLGATLESVSTQTYDNVVEVLVADGRSVDATREVAQRFPAVRVVDNPARLQAAGLNRALDECRGEIVVRVDGHCLLAPDYVDRCVEALERTNAAIVGGAMSPVGHSRRQRGIAAAMRSRLGAGPARFHVGGPAGWVDTVYLGAYRRSDAQAVGRYAEDVGVNEDAEFAIRMTPRGGVWFEPGIRSSYSPRESYRALLRQFYRYGRSRAATARRHPSSIRLRQLAAPALLLGLASRWRLQVAIVYGGVVGARAARELLEDAGSVPGFLIAMPIMHVSWGCGFFTGLFVGTGDHQRAATPVDEARAHP